MREGERENFSICLYFHAHTWQAKAHEQMENKERIEELFFFLHLSVMNVCKFALLICDVSLHCYL